jgi:hypothetical protein
VELPFLIERITIVNDGNDARKLVLWTNFIIPQNQLGFLSSGKDPQLLAVGLESLFGESGISPSYQFREKLEGI